MPDDQPTPPIPPAGAPPAPGGAPPPGVQGPTAPATVAPDSAGMRMRGMVLASAFSAIVVFAQELMPGRVGMVSGLFFGFAFGMSGVGAAVLGKVADVYGISFVYQICSFLPLIGLMTALLPNLEPKRRKATA